jgi:uncharacterized protein YjbI with pentapeptide repeats
MRNQRIGDVTMIIKNHRGEVVLELDERRCPLNLADHNLDEAEFDNLVMEGALFIGTSLREATFARCDLYWASFICADMSGAHLIDSTFHGASFADACCVKVQFIRCDFGADAFGKGAIFRGANLSDAQFENCILRGATYDSSTIFPLEFLAEAEGMRLEDT